MDTKKLQIALLLLVILNTMFALLNFFNNKGQTRERDTLLIITLIANIITLIFSILNFLK